MAENLLNGIDLESGEITARTEVESVMTSAYGEESAREVLTENEEPYEDFLSLQVLPYSGVKPSKFFSIEPG